MECSWHWWAVADQVLGYPDKEEGCPRLYRGGGTDCGDLSVLCLAGDGEGYSH